MELSRRLGLTRRLREVARLICMGCSNAQIGRTLGVDRGTVTMHTGRLFTTLRIRTRVGVPVRVFEEFLNLMRKKE